MQAYVKALSYFSRITHILGNTLCWLAGLMVAVVVGVVILRTFFSVGSVAAQESVTYMHATMFLLCLPFAAQQDAHVRVDIFYRNWGELGKAWVNLLGALLFLIPFAVFLVFVSWPFTLSAWSIAETSINPGGIPAVFLLKTLIPLSGVLLAVFGICQLLDNIVKISFKFDE